MSAPHRPVPLASHEESDVGAGFFRGAFVLLLASLAGIALLGWWLFPNSLVDKSIPLPLPIYPQPRLQASPAADMRAFHAQEMETLNGVGWVDKNAGVVHIPIGDAMRKITEDGVDGWGPGTGGAR